MLVVVSDESEDRHLTGPEHPEQPSRLGAALGGIDAAGLSDAVVRLPARPATDEELQRVHCESYLEALRTFCVTGGGLLDPDTVASPGSWDTALLAAGSSLVAVEALRRGEGDAAFVMARPPGHHATRDQAMGFCLLNNVAVAAAALAADGQRVLVVDWDVHHGNGTQDAFWDDPRVLYGSVHQWPLYPGTGRAVETGGPSAPGGTVNVPVPGGATGDVALAAFDEVLVPAAERFRPDWVLVSAGFDAHRRDPLADLEWSAGDFADLAARVGEMAPAPGRTIYVLEGGYDLEALRLSVGAVLAQAVGVPFRPEPATSGGPGSDAVAAAQLVYEQVGVVPGA